MVAISSRRAFLVSMAAMPLAASLSCLGSSSAMAREDRLREIERSAGGRLGVFAINTANGATIRHRADERFAFCSTFKLLVAAAILRRVDLNPSFLYKAIPITAADVRSWSPLTKSHAGESASVDFLCSAALTHSDNGATNLLLRELGGREPLINFAREIGDQQFRLDRWEPDLNTAIPGDERDTTTPEAMAKSLQTIMTGSVLSPISRQRLEGWMTRSVTGDERIKAGVPAGWRIAGKTGSGDFGTTNDVALIRPPGRAPLVVSVYYTQADQNAPWKSSVIATSAKVVVEELSSV